MTLSTVRAGLVLTLVIIWAAVSSEAQEGLTKRDRRGPVTVEVTLILPATTGERIRAKVVLDTHSVALDGTALDQVVVLRVADGADVAPTAVEAAKDTSHHREAVLVFPPAAGAGTIRILVRNVGGVAERSFSWDLSPAR